MEIEEMYKEWRKLQTELDADIENLVKQLIDKQKTELIKKTAVSDFLENQKPLAHKLSESWIKTIDAIAQEQYKAKQKITDIDKRCNDTVSTAMKTDTGMAGFDTATRVGDFMGTLTDIICKRLENTKLAFPELIDKTVPSTRYKIKTQDINNKLCEIEKARQYLVNLEEHIKALNEELATAKQRLRECEIKSETFDDYYEIGIRRNTISKLTTEIELMIKHRDIVRNELNHLIHWS